MNYCNNSINKRQDSLTKLKFLFHDLPVRFETGIHIRILFLIFKGKTYQRIISFIIADVWQDGAGFINGGQSRKSVWENKMKVRQVTAYSSKK